MHGLGLNPGDGLLYADTHYGVWRVSRDGKPVRIADRYQDTMGLTVAGRDRFLGSGHPDLREDLPPHLGLIESRDRADTWRSLSLLGEVDYSSSAVQGLEHHGWSPWRAMAATHLTHVRHR